MERGRRNTPQAFCRTTSRDDISLKSNRAPHEVFIIMHTDCSAGVTLYDRPELGLTHGNKQNPIARKIQNSSSACYSTLRPIDCDNVYSNPAHYHCHARQAPVPSTGDLSMASSGGIYQALALISCEPRKLRESNDVFLYLYIISARSG